MEKNNHDWIDIFKIDVEGGEWEILKAIVDDFPNGLPFGQMQIEVHVNRNEVTVESFNDWWKMLEAAGLRAFHQELSKYFYFLFTLDLLTYSRLSDMPTTPGSGMYYSEYSFINIRLVFDFRTANLSRVETWTDDSFSDQIDHLFWDIDQVEIIFCNEREILAVNFLVTRIQILCDWRDHEMGS